MTMLTLTPLFLSGTALLLGIYALRVALRSSDRTLAKQLSALSTRCSEVEVALETLSGRVRSMRVSIHNRDRANRAAPDPNSPMTEADKDEWQRKMNLQLAMRRFNAG